MAEMVLRATGSKLKIISEIHVTSTQAQYDTCLFEFDKAWDGYGLRTAVFYSHPKNIRAMVLDVNNRCFIPWDAFSNSRYLYIGVYGSDGESYLPTQFVEVMYQPGANIDDHLYPPTPGIYEQIAAGLAHIQQEVATKASSEQVNVIELALEDKASIGALDALRTQVAYVASGSPRGVFSTVAALIATNPDRSAIYLVTADSKWYYWDGDSWTAGGVYLSTPINPEDVDNAFKLTTTNKTSNDLIYQRDDGYYMGTTWNSRITHATFGTVYADVTGGNTYRVMVFSTAESSIRGDYAVVYFWDKNQNRISPSNYQYTVHDAGKKIIDIVAPANAVKVTLTHTPEDGGKNAFFVRELGGKASYDWLVVNETNLSEQLANRFDNAFELTTVDKISGDIIYLRDNGYYMGTTWSGRVTHATFGTAYADVIAGNTYRVKVFSTTEAHIRGDYAVVYFWDKNQNRISPSSYQYTVHDADKKIIDIMAPANAAKVTMTYSPETGGKDAYFVLALGGKATFDWLVIDEENLSDALREKVLAGGTKDYGHCLAKPFDFAGKTITFFGDSITAGSTSPDLAVTPDPYCKIFADRHGMTSDNRAVGGAYICDTESPNSILNRVINYSTPRDFIWIAGGTNDWTFGKPVGVLGDTTGGTFYGALRVMCEHLKTVHSTATVIFITPINQNVGRPNAIASMDAYRSAIFEVATSYGFNVVDGSQIGFPKVAGAFSDLVCSDGVHPTVLGHEFYARSLMGILG